MSLTTSSIGTTTVTSNTYRQHKVYFMGRVWYKTTSQCTMLQTSYGPKLPARVVHHTTIRVSSIRADLQYGQLGYNPFDTKFVFTREFHTSTHADLPSGFIPDGVTAPF